jgi:hypothetical protein
MGIDSTWLLLIENINADEVVISKDTELRVIGRRILKWISGNWVRVYQLEYTGTGRDQVVSAL